MMKSFDYQSHARPRISSPFSATYLSLMHSLQQYLTHLISFLPRTFLFRFTTRVQLQSLPYIIVIILRPDLIIPPIILPCAPCSRLRTPSQVDQIRQVGLVLFTGRPTFPARFRGFLCGWRREGTAPVVIAPAIFVRFLLAVRLLGGGRWGRLIAPAPPLVLGCLVLPSPTVSPACPAVVIGTQLLLLSQQWLILNPTNNRTVSSLTSQITRIHRRGDYTTNVIDLD